MDRVKQVVELVDEIKALETQVIKKREELSALVSECRNVGPGKIGRPKGSKGKWSFSAKMRLAQRRYWARLTPEQKKARVKKMQAGRLASL